MKRLLASVIVAALVAAVGCENKSPPGGPGATKPGQDAGQGKAETFKVKAPGETKLKQTETKNITIDIDRGKNFDQPVTLTFEMPKGLHVKPESVTIQAGNSSGKVDLVADKDASVGEQAITIHAKPTSGAEVSTIWKVHVDKGETAK